MHTRSVSLTLVATSILLAGCMAPPAPQDADTDPDTDLDAPALVLYMTSSTHAGRQGIHLVPEPGTQGVAAGCMLEGSLPPQNLTCEIRSDRQVEWDCDGQMHQVPWAVSLYWQGQQSEKQDWTVLAIDEDRNTVAAWQGEQLDCAGHLTE